jgi:hypothetical protein
VIRPVYKGTGIGSVATGSQDCVELVQLQKQDMISPIYKGTRIGGAAAGSQDCAELAEHLLPFLPGSRLEAAMAGLARSHLVHNFSERNLLNTTTLAKKS